MEHLSNLQILLVFLIFVWSGFVRSGLGFGGAVLSLPFLLLIDNNPLIFLPIICVHLLIFSTITVVKSLAAQEPEYAQTVGEEGERLPHVDWNYFKRALGIMIIPKLVGVLGVITLPGDIMTVVIFTIVAVYSLSYIMNKPFASKNKALDLIFLILGGYVSGSSLIGAPLIVAVFAQHVPRSQLRDTLFALWFVLAAIKLAAFIYAGVELQLAHQLWLLPAAALGHLIGLQFHAYTLKADTVVFFRIIGSVLLLMSIIGIFHIVA